MILMPN